MRCSRMSCLQRPLLRGSVSLRGSQSLNLFQQSQLRSFSQFAALNSVSSSSVRNESFSALSPHPQRRNYHQYPWKIVKNVPPGVAAKVGRNLHHLDHHPLRIIKDTVQDHFTQSFQNEETKEPLFTYFDALNPTVTTAQCFDELNIAADHPSRSPSDTFYYDETTLLRTHTSAHQTELMRQGHRAFLMSGDCYRRDEIDRSHYPVFHQMEGVRIWEKGEVDSKEVFADLQATLEGHLSSLSSLLSPSVFFSPSLHSFI